MPTSKGKGEGGREGGWEGKGQECGEGEGGGKGREGKVGAGKGGKGRGVPPLLSLHFKN